MLNDSYTYISKVLPTRKITNEYGKRFIQIYLDLGNFI